MREVIARFAATNAERFGKWITRTAENDAARAAVLYLRALEYHIPKLHRTELAGADCQDTKIVVQIGRSTEKPTASEFQSSSPRLAT